MKRSLVVTLLVAGLFAAVGTADTHVNPYIGLIADGQPPPPPTPPLPPAVLAEPNYQKTPWLTADGQPPPPPGPWLVQLGVQSA